MSVRIERLLDDLEALARFGRDPRGGVTRPAYGPSYREAVDWLTARCQDAGMTVREDPAGNLIARIGPEGGAAVAVGSHIDTVPSGGIYDGALGVLAPLECVRALTDDGVGLERALEIIAFADEEGAYLSLAGSRAMAGSVKPTEIEAAVDANGISLTEALADYGLDPAGFLEAKRAREEFALFLEYHIEQGPVLVSEEIAIGVVEAIAGQHLTEVTFHGEANHAGTTPPALRKDAFRAAAAAMTASFEAMAELSQDDLRLTYGQASLLPGASNVIPSRVTLSREVRAATDAGLRGFDEEIRRRTAAAAAANGVTVEQTVKSYDPPVPMSDAVVGSIAATCENLGIRHRRMLSGAGHDAQAMAVRWPTGMFFVPSVGGVSHSREEHTEPGHIETGTRLLYALLREAATQASSGGDTAPAASARFVHRG